MKKWKGVLVLTLTAFLCGVLLFLVRTIVGGEL